MDILQKTRNKVTAFAFATIVAFAMALAVGVVPAFADSAAWNDNVTVLAVGANGDTKTEAGQYINGTMTFKSDASSVTAAQAEAYLEANMTIAGRSLNAANYTRDVYDVAVNGNVITFKVGPNTAGMTANYNGKLNIAADKNSNETIYNAMGGKSVETLIGTGVAIANPAGTLSADGTSKTFQITDTAYNRGMIHVLIMNGNQALFQGTGTFSNGGITVHAHNFMTQTAADFASLICSAANAAAGDGSDFFFEAGEDGSFDIVCSNASNLSVYIYDGSYLNSIKGAVGEITEGEMKND